MAQHGRHRAPGRHVRPKALAMNALVAYGVVTALAIAGFVVRPHAANADTISAAYVNPTSLASTQTAEASARPEDVTTANVTVTEDIAPSKTTTLDADIAQGTEFVMDPGSPGSQKVTYKVTYVNGKEVSRSEVSHEVITQPKPSVVIQGSGDPKSVAVQLASAAQGTGDPAGNKNFAELYIQTTYGWGHDQFVCLSTLWDRESHWRHLARNRSSGAYGIAQALPGRKMASVASDWATNPVTQIKWGASYIEGRYNTPCQALDHSYAHGWY